jgi:hypothetical protein
MWAEVKQVFYGLKPRITSLYMVFTPTLCFSTVNSYFLEMYSMILRQGS